MYLLDFDREMRDLLPMKSNKSYHITYFELKHDFAAAYSDSVMVELYSRSINHQSFNMHLLKHSMENLN